MVPSGGMSDKIMLRVAPRFSRTKGDGVGDDRGGSEGDKGLTRNINQIVVGRIQGVEVNVTLRVRLSANTTKI